ncbi:MAG: sulfite exporter TauE/SafE family protein [Pseudomonadota bacterium]
MEGWTFAAAALVFLAGGIIKGAFGFGLPLVTIAILPFLVPVEMALALNAVVLLVVNAVQAWQYRAGGAVGALALPVMAGMVTAIPIVTTLAIGLPPPVVLGVLGAFVICFSLLELRPRAKAMATGAGDGAQVLPLWRGLGVGLIGGGVAALTSAPGPIFVMHLAALRLPRPRFMSVLGVLMCTAGLFLASSLAVAGVLTASRGVMALTLLPTAFLGFWIGGRLAQRFSVEGFRRAVLVVLLVLGATMIHRALS